MYTRTVLVGTALLALLLGPLPGAAAAPAPATAAGFQGAGGRVFWYDGLLEVLLERGVIEPGVTALGGASSGAVTALYTALGLSGTEQRDLNVATALGMLTGASFSESLREVLTRELPDNVTDIANALSVRVGIAQLDASRQDLNDSAVWVVQRWVSKEDLVDSLVASTYLPCFSGPTAFTVYRDQPAIDGGYAVGWKDVCPRGDSTCIRIGSNYPAATLEQQGCYWEVRDSKDYGRYQNGPEDQWALSDVQELCPDLGENLPYSPFPKPTIYPGYSGTVVQLNGTDITPCVFTSFSRGLPSGLELQAVGAMIDLGKADGEAWCDANGYPASR